MLSDTLRKNLHPGRMNNLRWCKKPAQAYIYEAVLRLKDRRPTQGAPLLMNGFHCFCSVSLHRVQSVT